ncbi:MAG: oligosaccharide flippase family protein, partial [Actinobacteria bacterium]|nr:oligosaccharide flippase family protein [Actinomycetota bacterium]
VLVGVLAGSWIMRLITITVDNPMLREQEIVLGAFFLWFFLPQILLYAVGAVSTGLLHADHRFSSPAAAPALNNMVVIVTMILFWVMRGGTPTLDLSLGQKLVLALGTTLGVVAMTLVPVVAARRSGFLLRPTWRSHRNELRSMAARGAWAAGYLGLTQALLAVTLVLANRVEGGAVAYQIAFTFFLLPYALVGNPILTTLFPRLSTDVHQDDRTAFGEHLGTGLRQLSFLVLPASVLLVVLSRPLVDVLALGALSANAELVARTLAGYALGLIGYSTFQLLTRASYADEDTRTPTVVNFAMMAVGSTLMLWWSAAAKGADRVASLGLAHSVVQLGGALVLLLIVSKRVPEGLGVATPAVRALCSSLCAGAAAWLLSEAMDLHGRIGAGVTTTAAGMVGVAIYAGVQLALGSPELRRATRQEADI